MEVMESSPQAVRRHAKAWAPAIVAAALLLAGCGQESESVLKSKFGKILPPAKTNNTQQPDANWTPEKISTDPAGYLQYAANKVSSQIAGRKQKLAELAAQRADIDARAQSLITKVSDAQNIIKRLKTAMQRADDENNWPFKMANRTFDQAQADGVIKSLEQFIADRQPLVGAYNDAQNRTHNVEATLNDDIQNLEHMRENIGLDLERVRLNQTVADIGELHKTETELAAFSKTLADMSDDSSLVKLGTLGAKTNEHIDAESLLR